MQRCFSNIHVSNEACSFLHSIMWHNLIIHTALIVLNSFNTPGRRQSKTLILSTNVDKKSLEMKFSIVSCRPTGDKWQSKKMVLESFDPHSPIVKSVFDCRLPGVFKSTQP